MTHVVENEDGSYAYGGDLIAPAERVRLLADDELDPVVPYAATIGLTSQWPGRVMAVEISASFPAQDRITWAMSQLQDVSGIRFVTRTTHADWVRFVVDNRCASYVGRIGGPQTIWLANACDRGSTLHEFMHALGMYHEQSRSDRDQHVQILWNNIQDGSAYNFEKASGAFSIGPYDYASRMHYRRHAFSKNGQPTIVRRDGVVAEFSGPTVSQGDIAALYQMYGHRSTAGIDGRVCGGAGRYQPPPLPPNTPWIHVQQITRLYCAAFDRLPDSGGFDYWVRQRNAGASLEAIANHFAASAEYRSRFGTTTRGDFVATVYRLVLDRNPDRDGYAYWVKRLLDGASRGWVLIGFSESAEFRNLTAGII